MPQLQSTVDVVIVQFAAMLRGNEAGIGKNQVALRVWRPLCAVSFDSRGLLDVTKYNCPW